MATIAATVETSAGGRRVNIAVRDLVLAGWTGRDKAAMEHHIAELEALGVKRPATTPIYYRVSATRLTTGNAIEVMGTASSGEIEFVLAATGGELLVGLGSDHTDRKAETFGITLSKQLCDKPIATTFWRFADLVDHWDDIVLRAYITNGGKRELYQEGTLAKMLPPEELLRGYAGAARGGATRDAGLSDGTMMFGGTFAAIGGIRGAERFEGELDDARLGRRITLAYDIRCLPVLG
jgi:Protein of unknown function (DUF2848)